MSGRKLNDIAFEKEEIIFDPHEYIRDYDNEKITDEAVAKAFWRGVRIMCEKGDASILCLLAMDEGGAGSDTIFNSPVDGSIDDLLERALKTVGVFYDLSYRQILNLWKICLGNMSLEALAEKINDMSRTQ